MTLHDGLPVVGYRPQSDEAVKLVNLHKQLEEAVLRSFDILVGNPEIDQRWLAIGRSHIEQGWMAVNRSIFRPSRVSVPGDEA